MAKLNKVVAKAKVLEEKAKANTTIKSKKSREKEVTIQEGTPVDHAVKHNPADSVKFGMSKGVTRNMGDYQSLRVDVWLSDTKEENESIEEAFTRIEKIIDETLEASVLSTVETM